MTLSTPVAASEASCPGASALAPAGALHIAHILPWSNIGGTEIATLRLIRAAAHAGHRATVFHLPGAKPVREMFASSGIPTVTFQAIEPSVRKLRTYVAASRALAARFRAMDVRVVHCADVRSAFMCGLAGRLAGVTTVCHVRNRYREFPFRWRQLLRRTVDHFVFVSRQTRTEFAVQLTPNRTTVLYDGIRIAADRDEVSRAQVRTRIRRSLNIEPGALVIGMVARIARQKDYETLIRAAAAVAQATPDVRFLLVGDDESAGHGEYFRELQVLISHLGLQQRFIFTGHRTDVDDLLDAMDVFVLSTHWEGFPLVILEAMGHSLPVVATAVDGIPEIVDDETGRLTAHGDAAGLASALQELLDDRGLATRLGANARARVERQFSDASFIAAVAELYAGVAGRLPAGRG